MRFRSCTAFLTILSMTWGHIQAAEPVRMVLQWEHQAQFAGYYMALDKGFYQEEGLDVELLSGGPDVDPIQRVLDGDADFCSAMLATALYAQLDGKTNLVLQAQIINRSNLALVAWKHGRDGMSLIEKPADLNGKQVTVWETFAPPYHYYFKRHQIQATTIPQYYTFSLFLHKGADACCAMTYNEVHAIEQCHIPEDQLTIFNFYDLGINFPEDGIYTSKQTEQTRPDVCAAFARASLKGWTYAQAHPEETLDAVMQRIDEAVLPTNRAHMQWMLKTILESIFPQNESDWTPGILSVKNYQKSVSIMRMGKTAVPYANFVAKGAQDGLD